MLPDPNDVIHLPWESEQPRGGVRVARTTLSPDRRFKSKLHVHDFAEFMLIESGRCEHVIGGTIEILEPGDYRCIRAGDVHLPRSGDRPCSLINISFMPDPLAGLAERYGDDWLWPSAGPPRGGRLNLHQRERLSSWLELLSSRTPRRIDLEAFLLDLTRMLSDPAGDDRTHGLPAWLAEALEVFAHPRYLQGGVAELARLCDRSVEHLNRVVRAAQGRRTTDLVNAIRMEWVAAQLHRNDEPVESLAAACGLPNLANFYRLFRATYGTTPAAWRRSVRQAFPRNQALNVSPWPRE